MADSIHEGKAHLFKFFVECGLAEDLESQKFPNSVSAHVGIAAMKLLLSTLRNDE